MLTCSPLIIYLDFAVKLAFLLFIGTLIALIVSLIKYK